MKLRLEKEKLQNWIFEIQNNVLNFNLRKHLFESYWYNNISHIYNIKLSYYIKKYVLLKYIEHDLSKIQK